MFMMVLIWCRCCVLFFFYLASDKFLLASHRRWWVLIGWRPSDRAVHERLRMPDSRYEMLELFRPLPALQFISFPGGTSRGDCALGFGACCVCKFSVSYRNAEKHFLSISRFFSLPKPVETTCDDEVYNNVTYFVSPKFPALMPNDRENCSIRVKLVSDDISQIRLDFLHFTLVSFFAFIPRDEGRKRKKNLFCGEWELILRFHLNRASRIEWRARAKATSFRSKAAQIHSCFAVRTVASMVRRMEKSIFVVKCSSSWFSVFFSLLVSRFSRLDSTFNLVFYDVGEPLARAESQELKININLNKRSVSTRLWEIRISQIPFSSRAPSGCLQHFTGIEGKYLHISLAVDRELSFFALLYPRTFKASSKPSTLLITVDIWRIRTTSRVWGRRKAAAAFSTSRAMINRSG